MLNYIFLAILFVCSFVSYDYGSSKKQKEFVQYKLIMEQKLKEQILANKQLEGKIISAQRLNQLEKEREIYSITKRYDSIVSSLRERPTRTDPPKVTNTEATTTESARAGSTGQQLFREDAEFLIGEATKAMILRQSLIDCRKNYEAISGGTY